MSQVEARAAVPLRRVKSAPAQVDGRDRVALLEERVAQLQQALDSRIVIEQAKGVIAERHGLRPDEAFQRIRREARSRRIKIHDLAAGIVASAGVRSGFTGPNDVA